MKRFAILGSLIILGTSTIACSGANPTNSLAPSAAGIVATTGSQPVNSLLAAGGRGGGKGNSTVPSAPSLALVIVTDANGDNAASWGDTIRITVTNPPADPNVEVTCSQGGVVVYAAQTGYYANTWPSTGDFILGSRMWTGGSASCTARLYVFSGAKINDLATMDFAATAE